MSGRTKVFGIGFHKTGTTSLKTALKRLGYSVTGPESPRDPDIALKYMDIVRDVSARFDAFQDNPWPLVFREMDAMWPGSKFVLTHRAPEAWILSQVKQFGTRTSPMRQMIYGADHGCPEGNEARYLEVYQTHNAAVRNYFRDRPDDLLDFDLTVTPDWAPLCAFLGKPVPDRPFPHNNSAAAREMRSAERRG